MEDDVQAWSGKTANKIVDEMYSVGILAEENLDTARALAQQQIAETLLRLLGKLSKPTES
jgi:hypothetical protein